MEARKDKREEVDCWIQKSKSPLESVSYQDRLVFEFFRISKDGPIEELAKQNGLNILEISNLLKDKTEELSRFLPEIYKLNNFIFRKVKNFLSEKRLKSWFKKDYGNVENSSAQCIDSIIEKDENGATKDISIDTSRVRPPDLYSSVKNNPEESFLDNEFNSKIMTFLTAVESSGKKHAPTYRKILEMELFEGINVRPLHGPILGVPEEKVPSLKHQALKLAKKLILKKYPELIEVIDNLEKGTKHKIKKSTREDREMQRRSNGDDEMKKHGSILIWTRNEGSKTLSYKGALQLPKPMLR